MIFNLYANRRSRQSGDLQQDDTLDLAYSRSKKQTLWPDPKTKFNSWGKLT